MASLGPSEIAFAPPATVDRRLPAAVSAAPPVALVPLGDADASLNAAREASRDTRAQQVRRAVAALGCPIVPLDGDANVVVLIGPSATVQAWLAAVVPSGRPVIIVVALVDAAGPNIATAFAAGAAEVVPQSADEAELRARLGAVIRLATLVAAQHHRDDEFEVFAQRASHDLKAPLAVIRGMADTLASAWDRLGPERRDQLLRAVSSNASRAAAMVSDLLSLALAHAESGEAPCALAATGVIVANAVVAQVLSTDDHISVDGDLPDVAMPAADLTTIIVNIIDNATHYGRDEAGRLHLAITGTRTTDALVIELEDHGAGVPPDATRTLFDPFVRLAGSGELNPDSTGIGLAIVARAVQRWGGRVGVEAGGAGGARFVLVLPLAQPDATLDVRVPQR